MKYWKSKKTTGKQRVSNIRIFIAILGFPGNSNVENTFLTFWLDPRVFFTFLFFYFFTFFILRKCQHYARARKASTGDC